MFGHAGLWSNWYSSDGIISPSLLLPGNYVLIGRNDTLPVPKISRPKHLTATIGDPVPPDLRNHADPGAAEEPANWLLQQLQYHFEALSSSKNQRAKFT